MLSTGHAAPAARCNRSASVGRIQKAILSSCPSCRHTNLIKNCVFLETAISFHGIINGGQRKLKGGMTARYNPIEDAPTFKQVLKFVHRIFPLCHLQISPSKLD